MHPKIYLRRYGLHAAATPHQPQGEATTQQQHDRNADRKRKSRKSRKSKDENLTRGSQNGISHAEERSTPLILPMNPAMQAREPDLLPLTKSRPQQYLNWARCKLQVLKRAAVIRPRTNREIAAAESSQSGHYSQVPQSTESPSEPTCDRIRNRLRKKLLSAKHRKKVPKENPRNKGPNYVASSLPKHIKERLTRFCNPPPSPTSTPVEVPMSKSDSSSGGVAMSRSVSSFGGEPMSRSTSSSGGGAMSRTSPHSTGVPMSRCSSYVGWVSMSRSNSNSSSVGMSRSPSYVGGASMSRSSSGSGWVGRSRS